MGRLARISTALLVGAPLFVFAAAAPAGAVFTENTIGCSGSAVLTAKNGTTYNANANATTIKVPRDGSANYQGSITTTTHNHKGEIDLEIGPFKIPVASWGPRPNDSNQNSKDGVKDIPSAFAQIPAGKYRLSGFHEGKEGRCAGWVNAEVTGSPLSTPTGIVALALTVVSGAGLAAAAMASAKKAVGVMAP